MKHFLFFSSLGFLVWTCVPQDEIISSSPDLELTFSSDTVLFDTLFATQGSTTKRLRVFNPNKNAVVIDNISLATTSSPYTIYVDGAEGKSFDDQFLLGKDSLLILVEVVIDPNQQNLPFLVKDSIIFTTGGLQQDVNLLAWGQNANFLMDSILVCDQTWTADLPYVLMKSILVDSLCQLRLEPGTQVYADINSFIFIKGSLKVEGTKEAPVYFLNERLEEQYSNLPGQWQGIFFLEGSKDNLLNWAVIRNARYGLRVGSPDEDTIPDVDVRNTIIENMLLGGIAGFSSDIKAVNTLVNNCGQFVVGNFAGGNYIYEHCTFANYGFDFFRAGPSAIFTDNLVLDDNSLLVEDMDLRLVNTIIWGSQDDEVLVSNDGGADFRLGMSTNNIRSTDGFWNSAGNIVNQDPMFVNPEEYNYRLDSLSPVQDAGIDIGVPSDLDGNSRDEFPDIGAYERISN